LAAESKPCLGPNNTKDEHQNWDSARKGENSLKEQIDGIDRSGFSGDLGCRLPLIPTGLMAFCIKCTNNFYYVAVGPDGLCTTCRLIQQMHRGESYPASEEQRELAQRVVEDTTKDSVDIDEWAKGLAETSAQSETKHD